MMTVHLRAGDQLTTRHHVRGVVVSADGAVFHVAVERDVAGHPVLQVSTPDGHGGQRQLGGFSLDLGRAR